MILHPPSAEADLDDENTESEEFTPCITEFEIESPMVEEERSDDALCYIVGETHSAVRHDEFHRLAEFCAIECEEKTCHNHEHEACLVN